MVTKTYFCQSPNAVESITEKVVSMILLKKAMKDLYALRTFQSWIHKMNWGWEKILDFCQKNQVSKPSKGSVRSYRTPL